MVAPADGDLQNPACPKCGRPVLTGGMPQTASLPRLDGYRCNEVCVLEHKAARR